ncbi:hypothetical protein RHSIM_RhsimUnG0160200 [Rhododendron simsii]|uniref:ARID domain-containing protein n=1 Tax=Rhododendron simsii TaxID=118357 RepID=A0A834FUM4_RHOSS|nr:hypothetical protein RHSIM_RhsimUnG0160200 [Rhododendron simsii]
MEGWSKLNGGSNLYEVGTVQTFSNKKNLCFDLDSSIKHGNVDDCNERLKGLFDQLLLVFLGEVSREKQIPPIPALFGDGQPADLFKLFWVTWKLGGYDFVSRNGLWAFVAEGCGLDGGVMASLKLVYMKYLNELEQWLRKAIRGKSLGNGESEVSGKFGLLLLELEKEFRGLLSNEQDVKKKEGKLVELQRKKNGICIDVDVDGRELLLPVVRGTNEVHGNAEKIMNDDDEKICFHDENEVSVLETPVVRNGCGFQKRKRESVSLLGMLNWVIEVAKHPEDPAMGRIPDCSEWKEYSSKEMWVQALLAREVLLRRQHFGLNTEESVLQKKLKMHPSFYEDSNIINHRSAEGLRCSERLPSFTKPRFCPCCNSCSASPRKAVTSPSKVVTGCKVEDENKPKEQPHLSVDIRRTNQTDGIYNDEPFQKLVSVGPLFQAEVPEWTGIVAESDSKWLGTRFWPSQNRKHKSLMETDPFGKGKQYSCSCQIPGSVRCIRFHIAENRMKLKLELGSLFYQWGFDRMGEEVSLSWTIAEEKRFKDMVRLKPPSLNKFFWDIEVYKYLPTKTREKLVRYYLNVFLVRRRAYQNRVTPKDIDSDDDETEFGCVGGSYGYESLNMPGCKLLICTENKQCTDF